MHICFQAIFLFKAFNYLYGQRGGYRHASLIEKLLTEKATLFMVLQSTGHVGATVFMISKLALTELQSRLGLCRADVY